MQLDHNSGIIKEQTAIGGNMQGGSHPNVKIVFCPQPGEIGLFDTSSSTLVEGTEKQPSVWVTAGGNVISEDEHHGFKLLTEKEAIFWFSRAGKLPQCPDSIIQANIIK